MKKTTRILLFSAVAAISFGAWAQSGQMLFVVAKNAEGQAVAEAPVSTTSALAFSENGVEVLSDGTLSAVFNYKAIQSIGFRYDGTTAVESVTADETLRLRQNPVPELLEFSSYPADAAALTITDLKGAVRTKIQNWSGEAVNVSSLTPGLYFVTVNNTTIKFIKK